MSENERKEFVDELLDASLRRYAEAEPRPGLEERLLAAVPEQARRFAWASWAWIPAAATAAILFIALAFYATREIPAPSAPVVAQQAPAPVAPAMSTRATTPAATARPVVRRERLERVVAAPRLASFPARAPLSEQERLLLQFMQRTPKEQLMARQLGAAPIERLEFKPLSLPPLESSKSTAEN